MRQFSTLYIPGCDHAGIATQAVVEKQLARHPKDGKSKRQDFSRAEFVQLCQEWKEDYHQAINRTIRRLGISVDWSREAFTMSPQLSKAVTETFVQLHSEGLIYRANRLVHWSCRLSTALSTLEVNQIELEGTTKLEVPGYDKKIEFGTLTYFNYPIEGSDQTIEVATTRPETMLGDTGIAVHPQDDRYKDFVGKTARHPIIPDRMLRIVADEYVDREFGTGAVKLTPAHDHNDFNLGKKHDLPFINILNEDGTLNSNAGPYAGQKRFNARYGVIEELKKLGLYSRQEPNKMVVPICSRSGDVIEPLLKPQWWMRMESLTKPAIAVVESGELVIRPELQKRQYLQWMRNLQDWCLSRQLWWGHQIPAYYISIEGEEGGNDANDDYWVCGRTDYEAQEKAEQKFPGKKVTLKRDEDVLDTWFSSGLWPFSTLGWPDKTADLEYYFPTTTLETGWDIMPFWVSRMIMFSLKLTGQVPFKEVFCHGLIRDSDGRKMSKSLGNVIDPIDILDGINLKGLHHKLLSGNLVQSEVKNAEKYQKKAFPQGIPEVGADALRFSLINYTQSSGSDINFDIKTMHGYRKFCNKIYQATKYVLKQLGNDFVPCESSALTGKESLPDRWILTKMNTAAEQMNQALEEREFARSTQISYRYLYDELFDVYIENSKSIISDGTPKEARSAMDTLYTTIESGLRLVSPFMPFLTEELWQRLPRRPGDNTSSITVAKYPEYESSFHDPKSEVAYGLVVGCSKGIRSLLADYAIKDKAVAYIVPLNQLSYDTVSAQLSAIESLSGKTPVKISITKAEETSPTGCAVFPVSADANVYLQVKDRIQDAAKEAEKFRAKVDEARREQVDIDAIMVELRKVQDKNVTDAMQSAESRKRDVEARLWALQETVTVFEQMKV
jgi:valyl-tRNA synthetase